MAEKIISPGVFTNEIDQTFLPTAVADIGAALIGPTVKGPAGIPTIVTSFSDFQAKFGDSFKTGSDSVQFLTSHTAEEYLKNSDSLTVVRILADGTQGVGPATATIAAQTGSAAATATFTVADGDDATADAFTEGEFVKIIAADGTVGIFILSDGSESGAVATGTVLAADSDLGTGTPDSRLLAQGTCIAVNNNLNTHAQHLVMTEIAAAVVHANSPLNGKVTAASISGTGAQTLVFTQAGLKAFSSDAETKTTTNISQITAGDFVGGGKSFTLETLAHGSIMNNSASHGGLNSLDSGKPNNILLSGSKHNIRYEVSNVNTKKGTFTLLLRAGNDNIKRKQILETFNNVSLDPNSTNYVSKVIGDQTQQVATDGVTKYLQLTGSYQNKSRLVRVKTVSANTNEYLDENGNVREASSTGSLPNAGSGSFGGGFKGGLDGHSGFDALGNQNGDRGAGAVNFYETITNTNSQGFDPTEATDGKAAYEDALNLLANQDEFDVNLILLPGIISNQHTAIAGKAIDVCEDRGDCFTILDPVLFGSNVADATTQAETRDSNFAAMYWPWIKVSDSQVAGTQRWVPPSVVLGGVYAFNDRVAHPWFAPAGLNRGGITTAIQAERKLTQGQRDTLYDSSVNPIATFPGQGVTVFGQKTLQKKPSALDRINVRRLLIRVKKFIASSSRFLVFEQNTAATRRRFLGIVNPFLEQVQSQSGLSAFRVVMDETNNTPDSIDRNQLIGQLFLQPTRTAEFIVLDFTIQPTGAAFPE
jgi:phage tail sheath protein FI